MCTLTIENDNNSNESYKIQDNCCKESYIGDYAVTNCNYYGNYDEFKDENFGKNLKIEYDKESDVVLLISGEDKIIGELQLADSDKKIFKPYLNSREKENRNRWSPLLYTCRISQNDEKAKINDRLRVTVWVKKLIKCV